MQTKTYNIIFLLSLLILWRCQSSTKPEESKPIISNQDQSAIKSATIQTTKKIVLGWHRDNKDKNNSIYNYDILNILAYFSYEINPKTGENKKVIEWQNAEVIDSAQANNCKVYLTIENFGGDNNRVFLDNLKVQENLIKNCIQLLKTRNANGICVDFEAVPKSHTKAYNSFLKNLGEVLKQNHFSMIVVLQLYEPENRVLPKLIDSLVDHYVMMGYACYHKGSHTAGPISPLKSGEIWEPYSLVPNIEAYLNNNFPAQKFIVALPLYGGLWQTESTGVPAKSIKGVSNPTVNKIMRANKNNALLLDSTSQSNYYNITKDGKTYQYWFEGPYSLKVKIEYIKKKKLAGIGLWALGYAENNKAIWNSIEQINQ